MKTCSFYWCWKNLDWI